MLVQLITHLSEPLIELGLGFHFRKHQKVEVWGEILSLFTLLQKAKATGHQKALDAEDTHHPDLV